MLCLPIWAIIIIAFVCCIVAAVVIAVIVTLLVVTLPQQQRPDPPAWLSRRAIVSASTSEKVVQSTRKRRSVDDDNLHGSTTASINNDADVTPGLYWGANSANNSLNTSATVMVQTTTIVLSSSPTQVQLLIVHGNVSVALLNSSKLFSPKTWGSQRRKRDISSKDSKLNDVPLLLVTADPYSGNITSIKATKNCSEPFKNAGLIVARSMLTNQDPSAYSSQTSGSSRRKRREALVSDCDQLEHIGGNSYCPQFIKQTTENRTVYKKTYSTGSAVLRVASSQNLDMNIQFETHVANDQQTLVKSQVSGSAVLNAIRLNGQEPSQLTLEKSISTEFNQIKSPMNDDAFDMLQSLVSTLDFQEVEQKSDNNVYSSTYSKNFTATKNSTYSYNSNLTALTRKRRDSDSKTTIPIAKLFETDVNLAVELLVKNDSAIATVGLEIGSHDFPIASKSFGSKVANAITIILKVRKYVKMVLDDTKDFAALVATVLNFDFLTSINKHMAIIKSDVSKLNAAFQIPATQIAIEVQTYKNKVLAIRDSVVSDVKQQIQAASDQIIQIQLQTMNEIVPKNESITSQLAVYQSQIDIASDALSSIDANSSSFLMWQSLKVNASAAIEALKSALSAFISEKQNNSQNQIAPIQNSVNNLQKKLSSIANGTYSFAQELSKASLLSIDNIFASFSQAERDIPLIVQNMTNEGILILSDLKAYVENFKSNLTTSANDIYNAFNDINSTSHQISNCSKKDSNSASFSKFCNILDTTSDDENIFDWAFMSEDIKSISGLFTKISSEVKSINNNFSSQIQSFVSDIKTMVSPPAWVQAYTSAIGQIVELQATFNYQIIPTLRTSASVESSAILISSNCSQQTLFISLLEVVNLASSENLQAAISKLVSANSSRDSLINAFLSNEVTPLYTITLFSTGYTFQLAQMATPIGIIGIGVILSLEANLGIGVILSSTKFAAVLTPGAKLDIGADAFWSAVAIQVGAGVGVSVQYH